MVVNINGNWIRNSKGKNQSANLSRRYVLKVQYLSGGKWQTEQFDHVGQA